MRYHDSRGIGDSIVPRQTAARGCRSHPRACARVVESDKRISVAGPRVTFLSSDSSPAPKEKRITATRRNTGFRATTGVRNSLSMDTPDMGHSALWPSGIPTEALNWLVTLIVGCISRGSLPIDKVADDLRRPSAKQADDRESKHGGVLTTNGRISR